MSDRVEGDRTDVPSYRTAGQLREDSRQTIARVSVVEREAATPQGRQALETIRGELVRLLAEVNALLAERAGER